MAKRLNPDTKITSTSDFTIGDIINAVEDNITNGSGRESIERVVKKVVRPCAIGGVPNVTAAPGSYDRATGGRFSAGSDGNTARFRNGRRIDGGSNNGCGGAANNAPREQDDVPVVDVPAINGKHATDEDQVTHDNRCSSPNLATDSKWYNVVLQNGEVWTPYTSRRFLPTQYMGMMVAYDNNIDAAIAHRYSLRDCFKLLDTEIEKLIFMRDHWRTAFAERSRFLPIETLRTIFTQYLGGLKDNINDRTKCAFVKRTGAFWRKIQGVGKVDLWVQKEEEKTGDNGFSKSTVSIEPTDWLVDLNGKIEQAERKVSVCNTYENALNILRNYLPHVSMGTFKDRDGHTRYWLPKAWKEAFKRQGAYYTLKSLVVNCHVRFATEDGGWRNRRTTVADSAREGLNKLKALLDTNAPAYVIHAILKKSIDNSRFDIARFLRQIRRH